MTNKEKLEIIDKVLEMLYEELSDLENFTTDAQENITQAIYNLESTKLLLEPLSNTPTIYECVNCGKQIECYGEFVNDECLKCGHALIEKTC